MYEFDWVGSEKAFIDEICVKYIKEEFCVGISGGTSRAGQMKNEDGCLVWLDSCNEWEFAVILDAHDTAESAELVLSTFKADKNKYLNLFKLEPAEAFNSIQSMVLSTFTSEEFKNACKSICGETSCLIVFRKQNYLWWLSIGDCILYLHHNQLARLGEYQQNHRSFFEWIGQNSTFNKSIPCYSTGRKELRNGSNHIFLTTDGLVECSKLGFDNPMNIFKVTEDKSHQNALIDILNNLKDNKVRDNTTILSWEVINQNEDTKPSDIS